MFDNICTLPLSSDLLTLAVHPLEPLFSVGLSSGHVETFRLPTTTQADTQSPKPHTNGTTNGKHERRTSTSSLSPGAPPPQNVTSVWRTRRHKGSCRAAAFSVDGSTLFTAGTDGILKAAHAEDGRVAGKIALPNERQHGEDHPSSILAVSPQQLVIGTDRGAVHVYDLTTEAGHAIPSSRPAQTFYPHRTKEDPNNEEAITSLLPLPPSGTSTSGTPRAFLTTAGTTLAVTDMRKNAVVAVSEDQGDDLAGIACVRGRSMTEKDTVLVGTGDGKLALFERGTWTDSVGAITVHKFSTAGTIIPFNDERDIECVALCPPHPKQDKTVCAVGLGNGMIKFVQIAPAAAKAQGKKENVLAIVVHDERGIDGVPAMGFDVEGRLISGGGTNVRVWHRQDVNPEQQDERPIVNWDKTVRLTDDDSRIIPHGKGPKGALPNEDSKTSNVKQGVTGAAMGDLSEKDNSDHSAEESSSAESNFEDDIEVDGLPPRKKRRKNKNASKADGRNSHGILKFGGLS